MSSTYTWADVLSMISQFANRQYDAGFAAMVVDQAQSALWHAADWKETIAQLAPFFVVPQEDEYGSPTAVIPSDFRGIRRADLVVTFNDPPVRWPLSVDRFLPRSEFQGQPTAISYDTSTKKLRLFPRPSAAMGAPWYLIDGDYKTKPTKLTPTNYASTLIPWDDVYLDAIIAVTKMKFFDLKGDQAAFGNQLQIAEYMVNKMAEDEAINTGDQNIAPAGILQLGWFGTFTY